MSNPFAGLDDAALIERKDARVVEVARLLARIGLAPDYAQALVPALRQAALPAAEHVVVLEALVEIEAIKYTLCARRLREINPEEGA